MQNTTKLGQEKTMGKNILITGGTGLVGTRLTKLLQDKGYSVSYLSRTAGEGKIKKYRWNVHERYLDDEAILGADAIIHLAGAGVFDKRWTPSYKKEIMESRVESSRLLIQKLDTLEHHVKTLVCATAIGLYGFDTGDIWLDEGAPAGEGYLAEVVKNWEEAIDQKKLNLRTVKIRVGIVLSDQGGALKEMSAPVKYFAGAPMGKGSQYLSWIHIDDLCNIFIRALEDENMQGAYNAAAPEPATNKTLTKEIAKILKKPLWLPNVPAFVLKMIVGSEAADILLGGNRVSVKKLIQTGFIFQYPSLSSALQNLLKTHK